MGNKTQLKRLKNARAVMVRVQENPNHRFNLRTWTGHLKEATDERTEQAAVSCGTSCCFAGWVALDKNAIKDGFKIGEYSGCPVYKDHLGWKALEAYFELSIKDVLMLADMETYPCDPDDIKPADVICRLDAIIERIENGQ